MDVDDRDIIAEQQDPLFELSRFELGLACVVAGMALGYVLSALPLFLL